jgi:hypothetical protein
MGFRRRTAVLPDRALGKPARAGVEIPPEAPRAPAGVDWQCLVMISLKAAVESCGV